VKVRLRKIWLLMVLQLWFMTNSVFAEGITVVVASEARVEGSFITLGQLAEISGEDAAAVKSLREIKLGSAPLPGSSLVLTRELLNMRLASASSDFNGITWNIPDFITVTANSQSISGQTLISKAIVATKEQVGLRGGNGDFTVTANGDIQDLLVPVGKIELTASFPYGIRYNIPTVVPVSVSVNGQLFTKVLTKLDVRQFRQVVVAVDQISSGDLFSTGNLRYARMDTGKLSAGYFTDMNKLIGLAARHSLNQGMAITDSMVVKPTIIKRGSAVNIVARLGSLEVTAMGQALQDGMQGQLIRVQNVNSNKIISAKVLDESTVEVLTFQSNE